jgi:2-amino-4-hydroxy-6-hydroxymethyldihydropteridine diphosphokinase
MSDSVRVALSLGGNLGDVPARFAWAVERLSAAGMSQMQVSGAYRTDPVGCTLGTPDFWNAAATGMWAGCAQALFRLCKRLEGEAGRPVDHEPCASRTLDLDLVFFGDQRLQDNALTIPHPEASRRLFVLIPLAEIAEKWSFPGFLGKTVGDVLADLAVGDPEAAAIHATRRSFFPPDGGAASGSCICPSTNLD